MMKTVNAFHQDIGMGYDRESANICIEWNLTRKQGEMEMWQAFGFSSPKLMVDCTLIKNNLSKFIK